MLIAVFAAIWVAACSGYDFFQKRVPNWLMAVGWIGAVCQRAYWTVIGKGNVGFQGILTILIWLLAVSFWLTGWWGAADAKFLMAVSLAFPDLVMLVAMAGVNLLVGVIAQFLSTQKSIPAVTCLGAGWLAWAIMVWR